MRRHDLVVVSPEAWRRVLASRRELADYPLVANWADKGWPLIRRCANGETHGVPLGLPLPPFAGKRRLEFVVSMADIVSITPPPVLESLIDVAPRAWWRTLDQLQELSSAHHLQAKAFGSLAWHALTGLDYLTDRSDLDLLLYLHRVTDVHRVTSELVRIETCAPMRLDGELVRDDDVAVNWRELYLGASEVLVKTAHGIALRDARLFLAEGAPS
jgi:phosphoribosyl-dephospho-CoA transferase